MQNRFYDEASNYRESFNAFLKEKTGVNVSGQMFVMKTTGDEDEPEPIDASELPQFSYRTASLSEVLESAIVDMGALALFNLLFFVGAFLSFLKYDVR